MKGKKPGSISMVILAAAFISANASADSPDKIEIPEALKKATDVPDDSNHLSQLFGKIGKATPEQTAKLRDALHRLQSGKGVPDKTLLDELLRVHELVNRKLSPPLAFRQDGQLVEVSLFRVFQGAEILARQAILENDCQRADRILSDMLRWSRALRNAQPNQMQWIISRYGWKAAFGTLLEGLPAKPSKFDEIDRLMRENLVDSDELAECVKTEAKWWRSQGGIKAMLQIPDAPDLTVFLKPPFNELSNADLLTLPYDAEADFQRYNKDTQAILDCLKKNVPVKEWPTFRITSRGQTIGDYRKLPNGLGDLIYEQTSPEMTAAFWNSALGNDRLLEACLLWLKTERKGEIVTEDLFMEFIDPLNGESLSIDLENRTIRSRGINGKPDPRESALGPLPVAGFTISGDDSVIVVPRWRSAAIDHGSDSK